jgi:hypothetical protein
MTSTSVGGTTPVYEVEINQGGNRKETVKQGDGRVRPRLAPTRNPQRTHVLLVDDGETVSKVQGLSLGDQGFDLVPSLRLSGIGQEVHDDSTLVDSFLDREQALAGDPTVLLSLLPRFTTFSDTDDDLETVITGVQGLTVTLRTVTDHGEGVILEVPGCGSGWRLVH